MGQNLEGTNWLGPFLFNGWEPDYGRAVNGEIQGEEANGGAI
jgi:hypothetical protein